jgi:hypothetical protein
MSSNSRCDLPVDYMLLWHEEIPGFKDWNAYQSYKYVHCLSLCNLSNYKTVNNLLPFYVLL